MSARQPAATAMAAMTMDHLSGGRFVLGLGTGGWHVVHWNLARDGWSQPGPGHIMKLRYTSLQVDTGFIVFNDRNYPRFERLLERLGVEAQDSDMGFSVSDGRGEFEYNGASINGLFARRSSLVRPSFHRMVRDLLRFNREAPALAPLSPREREVLDIVATGATNSAIAHRLGLSPKTVGNHISAIFLKLGVATRAEAVVIAKDAGLGRRD
jgi:DNA-binding CsgD family transcriptional regulator